MRSEQPVRCAKCYLRMESYELRIVHHKTTYHRHCFLMLLRENVSLGKAQRTEPGLAGTTRRTSA